MNTKTFDLEAAKRGDPICRIDCTSTMTFISHAPGAKSDRCVLTHDERGQILCFSESGWSITGEDLRMVVKTKTVWVNLYWLEHSIRTSGSVFETEEEAVALVRPECLRTVSVEIPA